MSDIEKLSAKAPSRESLEAPHSIGLEHLPDDPDANLSPEEREKIERALVRKLDWTLIPWLCILYLLAFLDRTNIGNAKVAGLNTDLHLSTLQYNSTLTIFFVSYAVFEPITNVMLKKLRPSVFLPIIMVIWGLSMFGMGFCHNYSGLLAARWFLGLAEAGLFPGVNYYLSCWYRRSEFGIRAAIFFSAAATAGSFGGLLAAGIEKMSGIGGKPGWAWIFILEGLLTVVFGVASFWMVHDFPDDARFLSDVDRARVIRRLKQDQQSSAGHEEWKTSYLIAGLKDWKMWLGMAIYMGCDMPLYAFSMFLPSIVQELGLGSSTITVQLLSVPPYVLAALFTVLVGFVADRTRQRGLCNMCVSAIGFIGFALLIAAPSPGARYAGTFLGALGIYPCISNTITWMANNTEGVYKRGVVLGFVIGWGNLNGIVSSNIYFPHASQKHQRYYEGHGIVIGYMLVFLFGGSLLMHVLLRIENKKRREGKREYLIEGKSPQEIDALGDERPDFFYTL
ncbi:major facilitator superfamily transporter [Pseudomassariella vexata]|uniref:Major facilitator superfamily transporter n=1 Tax=Pseudomassariella vexata TaxID=1141098 RepID=A0A1Y2DDY3_9PEZI|nr:major facilitator superfamily transporter [Pseudomassariella vexata]ORY57459.1 major facilitator superfamily transporter [Pseudomassariella vexata]